MENINALLNQMSVEDALHLSNLGRCIVTKYASTFTLEDQNEVYQILRFTILARTNRCRTESVITRAQVLCDHFTVVQQQREQNTRLVMVFDLTAKSYADCVVAQNEANVAFFGNITGNSRQSLMQQVDLFRLILAIGGAFHRPGVPFAIRNVTLQSQQTVSYHDMTYWVDPESYYMVVFEGFT